MEKMTVDINWLWEHEDANSVLARSQIAFERNGKADKWAKFHEEATSDDGKNLIITLLKYFTMVNTRANV